MKPTMLQTLLGLPSQSYRFPSEKDYYRSQANMRRVATDTPIQDKKVTSSREFFAATDTDTDDDGDTFYTADSSPRSSMAIPFPTNPMNSNASSTSLSSTAASVDGQSIFSSESPPSTQVTTPLTSESGHSKRSSVTYTDEDWAKEVRWLVQPIPRTKPRASPKSFRSSPASLSVPPRTKPPTPRTAHMSKSMSRATPSIMTVLEEDEDLALTQRPKSRVLINGPPNLQRRRSRSLENGAPWADLSIPSNGTPGYTSLTLPRAPPPPFQPISARGSHKVTMVGGGDGRIDLTISGVAQTTMLSVEVVQGLGLQVGKGLLAGLGRKRTVSKSTDDAGLAFTSYRKPPDYIPGSGVLVQVWAVGVDGVDATLAGAGTTFKRKTPKPGLFRSISQRSKISTSEKQTISDAGKEPEVGFVPGRSFVGRVLECGWEVRDEFIRKGEWVVGLLDMRKSGALQEFIIVDRHRVHRIPQPMQASEAKPQTRRAPGSRQSIRPDLSAKRSSSGPEYSRYPHISPSPPTPTRRSSVAPKPLSPSLSLEEFSLLPLCGVPAYRAVRTLSLAFSSSSMHDPEKGKRALVLRGHEGTGAMAVQMLVRRGWRVSAHVPIPIFIDDDEQRTMEVAYMKSVEDRVRAWGADEVIFDDGGEDEDGVSRIEDRGDDGRGAVVRVLMRLLDDGDAFDAILDTVGGKEVWDASERLLRSAGHTPLRRSQKGVFKLESMRQKSTSQHRKAMGLFVTLVGDYPDRPIPSAGDLFKTGLRSLKSNHKGQDRESEGNGKVGYVWINSAQDVDWEGEDTRDSLGAVVNMALNEGIRPFTGENKRTNYDRVVTFEGAPRVFAGHGHLSHGAVTVVKIVS